MTSIYIFHDQDHGDIEAFKTLEDAKKEGWPEDEEWQEDSDTQWFRGEYCFIYKRDLM